MAVKGGLVVVVVALMLLGGPGCGRRGQARARMNMYEGIGARSCCTGWRQRGFAQGLPQPEVVNIAQLYSDKCEMQ